MFELGRFITEEMKRKGLKRSEVAHCLGYANINRGLRRLDECINEGTPHAFIIQNLHTVLGVDSSVVQKALAITKKQMLEKRKAREAEAEERAREAFRPHLFINTELSRPTSITMAIFTGMADKTVNLPEDFAAHPPEKQLEIVQSVLRQHFKDNQGECRFFGKILGYYYVHHFRENIWLDVEGNVEMDETTPFTPPQGYITIGNKKITGGLFKFSEKAEADLSSIKLWLLNRENVAKSQNRAERFDRIYMIFRIFITLFLYPVNPVDPVRVLKSVN